MEGLDAAVFPSDLDGLEQLSAADRDELYDNLVVNRYLDPEGTVLWVDFFAEPANAADFWVNVDLGPVGPAVGGGCATRSPASTPAPGPGPDDPRRPRTDRRQGRRACWRAYPVQRLPGRRRPLRRQARCSGCGATSSTSPWSSTRTATASWTPCRRRSTRSGPSCARWRRAFRDIADDALGRIVTELDGRYLADGRVRDDLRAFFLDGGDQLGLWLDLDLAPRPPSAGASRRCWSSSSPTSSTRWRSPTSTSSPARSTSCRASWRWPET